MDRRAKVERDEDGLFVDVREYRALALYTAIDLFNKDRRSSAPSKHLRRLSGGEMADVNRVLRVLEAEEDAAKNWLQLLQDELDAQPAGTYDERKLFILCAEIHEDWHDDLVDLAKTLLARMPPEAPPFTRIERVVSEPRGTRSARMLQGPGAQTGFRGELDDEAFQAVSIASEALRMPNGLIHWARVAEVFDWKPSKVRAAVKAAATPTGPATMTAMERRASPGPEVPGESATASTAGNESASEMEVDHILQVAAETAPAATAEKVPALPEDDLPGTATYGPGPTRTSMKRPRKTRIDISTRSTRLSAL